MPDFEQRPGGRGPQRPVRLRRGDRRQPPHPAAVSRPGLALMYVARQVAAGYAIELGDRGYTWQDYVALGVIKAAPGLHQQGVSERTGLDRTTLGSLLAGLEDDGLVTRQSDPLDTRMLRISATIGVPSALAEMTAAMQRAEAASFRALEKRQRQRLAQLLAKLIPERQTLTEQVLADPW